MSRSDVAVSVPATARRLGRAAATYRAPQAGRLSLGYSLLLIAPLVLLLGGAFFWPILAFLSQSISKPSWTLEHYYRLFEETLYLRIMARTALIAAETTALTLCLGYPVAALMAGARGWTARIVAACVFLPLWTSVLVRSYAWVVVLQRNGMINDLLTGLGIVSQPIKLLYTEGAVLLAMTQVLMPFMIVPIFSVLQNIPADYRRAALGLGAGPQRAFFLITLPLSLPGVVAGSVVVFILALGFYITPALVGGPGTLMIATLISLQATRLLDWPFAAALSTLLLLLSLGLTYAFRRMIRADRVVGHA